MRGDCRSLVERLEWMKEKKMIEGLKT